MLLGSGLAATFAKAALLFKRPVRARNLRVKSLEPFQNKTKLFDTNPKPNNLELMIESSGTPLIAGGNCV
jgi:hypothetical protein